LKVAKLILFQKTDDTHKIICKTFLYLHLNY